MDLFDQFDSINKSRKSYNADLNIILCRKYGDYDSSLIDEKEPEPSGMTCNHNQLAEDFLKLLKLGTNNDVVIKLEDGEIKANKDILMIRSVYFSTMLGNSNFIEGKTNEIEMKSVKKNLMEKIIKYVYTGKISFEGLDNADVLKLMNLARILLLDFVYNWMVRALEDILTENLVYVDYNEHYRLLPSDGDDDEVEDLKKATYRFVKDTVPFVKELKLDDLKGSYMEFVRNNKKIISDKKREEIMSHLSET